MPRRILVIFAFLAGCGDAGGGNIPDGSSGQAPDAAAAADARPPAGRVAISPAGILLTAAGEQAQLRAEALDGLAGPVTWRSSSPETVSIDDAGRVTAAGPVGSAQVTATVAGVESPPVLVIVAAPAAGAVLVSDAEILDGPAAVDPSASPDLGFLVSLSLDPSVQVAPGTILLASEAKPVAGRVVSAQAAPTRTEVVLELVSLPDLFDRLELHETYRIDQRTYEDTPDEGTLGKRPSLIDSYQCEASVGTSFLVTGDARLSLAPDLDVDLQIVVADGELSLLDVLIRGTLTATGTVSVKFEAGFAGTLSCRALIKRIPLPVTGALSIIAGLEVPIGIKTELKGGLVAAQVELGGEVKVTSQVAHGLAYTPATGLVPLSTSDATVDFKPKVVLLEPGRQFVGKLTLGVGPTAGLDVGIHLPLLGGASIGLLEASLQLQLDTTLYDWVTELAMPTLASKYAAKLVLNVGAGRDARKALEFFGGRGQLGASISTEKTLARSPAGSMVVDRPDIKVGDTATFTVRLDPTTFIGFENVEEIRIYTVPKPGEEFPERVATLAGGAEATWRWTPTMEDVGPHFFWALVVTKIGAFPMEIKEDSSVRVHVDSLGPKRWQGMITFEASGSEGRRIDPQTEGVWTVMGSGTIIVKEMANTPPGTGLLEEVSATASVTHTTVTTFTPEPGGPRDCRYKRTTTDTNAGGTLAPDRNKLAAQLLLNEATGEYSLFVTPPKLETTVMSVTTSSLSSGPDTCEPGTTIRSQYPDSFLWSDLIGSGQILPSSGTITGSATLTRGDYPPASYTVTWNLVGM